MRNAAGTSLWACQAPVELLFATEDWQVIHNRSNSSLPGRLNKLEDSVSELVEFLYSLAPSQLEEFWLPCRFISISS
jgi:hypothetical protein